VILEFSRIAPQLVFELLDEGDYLLIPVLIQNGELKPDKKQIAQNNAYWRKRHKETGEQMWLQLIQSAKRHAKSNQFINPDFRNLEKETKEVINHALRKATV